MPLFNPETPTEPETELPVTPDTEVNTNIPEVSFIVEDGTIVPFANSYCDLDYADEYAANKGYSDFLQLSDTEKKISIIKGTEFVDNFFQWKGTRLSQNQSLAFPRGNITDQDGYPVLGIPDKLKRACIEAALIVSENAASTLFETKDENGGIKKTKVDVLEIEYFENQGTNKGESIDNIFTSIYGILNYLLKGLYKSGEDSSSIHAQAIWEY